jgi:gamma-glutamyl-gamma-aminobutyrate hydrolase PuuD
MKQDHQIVAVSARMEWVKSHGEYRDALDQRMIAWLLHAGFLPFIVSNELDESSLFTLLDQFGSLAGVVLSGGEDIGTFTKRDQLEASLLAYAKKNHIAVLGICRGMQFMHQQSGGRLIEISGHVASCHPVTGPLTDHQPHYVHSYHRWAIGACADGYDPLAHDEDGFIEAMAHRHLPWQGWMWHPERAPQFSQQESIWIKELFSKTR